MSDYRHTLEEIGEKRIYGVTPPIGRLIAYQDRVYRVTNAIPEAGDVFLQPDDDPNAEGETIHSRERQGWRVLPEHYAVCSRCGEPMPCRELRGQWRANWELKRARELMSIPEGACWYCRKPISSRQRSVTFPGDNLKLPGGPPVMFHIGIYECRRSALDYQEKWVKAEPGREPFLERYDPYTGKPNATQRRLLAMAARGELGCHLTCVRGANPDQSGADYIWYPDRLDRGAEKYIKPLLDAGLLAEPIPQHLGYQRSHYILTDEGWATHRRYPGKRGAA